MTEKRRLRIVEVERHRSTKAEEKEKQGRQRSRKAKKQGKQRAETQRSRKAEKQKGRKSKSIKAEKQESRKAEKQEKQKQKQKSREAGKQKSRKQKSRKAEKQKIRKSEAGKHRTRHQKKTKPAAKKKWPSCLFWPRPVPKFINCYRGILLFVPGPAQPQGHGQPPIFEALVVSSTPEVDRSQQQCPAHKTKNLKLKSHSRWDTNRPLEISHIVHWKSWKITPFSSMIVQIINLHLWSGFFHF